MTSYSENSISNEMTIERQRVPVSKLVCAACLALLLCWSFLSLPCAHLEAWASEPMDGVSVLVEGVQLESAAVEPMEDAQIDMSREAEAAVMDDVSFGIGDFSRQNVGTNRKVNDVYYGYKFNMNDENSFSAVVADGYTIIYIDQSALDLVGYSLDDETFQQDFLTLLRQLDIDRANGGPIWSNLDNRVYFTSAKEAVVGEYVYRFMVEIEEGYYYATVTLEGSEDGSGGALYAESGTLAAANDTVINAAPTGMAALAEFFQNLNWDPLWVSIRTTATALLFIFILGLLAAWLTLNVSERLKGVLDTVFTIPMVLPPTVCGFLLLLLFGRSTWIGNWFIDHGLDLVFTWPAAVIACIVVGFPMMYRTVRGAFENLDARMLDAARTLGWSESKVFAKLMLPLAWPSIAAGTVLAFARAMGEFGCTLFFAGNYAGVTQTIPLAIYFDWMGGRQEEALFWAAVVILISFAVILFINIYSSRANRYK